MKFKNIKVGQIVAVHWRDISSYTNMRSGAWADPDWIKLVTTEEQTATTYGEVVAVTKTHIIVATTRERDKRSYTSDAMVIPYGVIIKIDKLR